MTNGNSVAELFGFEEGGQFNAIESDVTVQDVNVIPLNSEGPVSEKRIAIRKALVQQLRQVPDSFLAFWQIMAIESGCRHGCAMCSQETSTIVTSFTQAGLEDILSALLTVATERRGGVQKHLDISKALVGYGFDRYRPGLMKLSHANDSGDSLLLEDTVRHLYENFGVKARLSMVAYSRHDKLLQRMHEKIVDLHVDAVDSVRFTFSSHPLGWRQNQSEYMLDYANMLRTWKPFVDQRRGKGRYHGAITEFRMDPDIEIGPLDDDFVLEHHVVRTGPTLLISAEPLGKRPPLNNVNGVQGRSPTFKDAPLDYILYTSDSLVRDDSWCVFAEAMIRNNQASSPNVEQYGLWEGCKFCARRGGLVHLNNCDGPFYAFEPTFQDNGTYMALNVYPQTQTRISSGLYNETRWCLNALLKYKAQVGIGRRERFPDATWEDVERILQEISRRAVLVTGFNRRAADYIGRHVVPLISCYTEVLKLADYSPEFVFDPNFTYLSGPLYNMGRAMHLFKGLVSKPNESITAAEMREYYLTYRFEPPTKLSPIPLLLDGELPSNHITGTKYHRAASGNGAIVFEQLNRVGMLPTRSLYIKGLVGLTRRRTTWP